MITFFLKWVEDLLLVMASSVGVYIKRDAHRNLTTIKRRCVFIRKNPMDTP